MKTLFKQIQSRFFAKILYYTIFILPLIGQIYSSIGQTVYNVGKYKLLRLNEIYFDITSSDTVDVTTNHMLIKLKEGLTENEKQAFNSRFPITPARTLSSGTILYDINQYTDFIYLIYCLSNDPDVHMYDINHLYRLTDAGRPNDSDDYITWDLLLHHPNALWPYEKTNLFDAWLLSNGSDDIIVAAIDNGLWVDHPDIATGPDSYSNIWYNHDDPPGNGDEDGNGYEDDINGWNFTENNNNLLMQNWNPVPSHGTRMTSIIAAKANNEIGIWGAAGGYGTPGVKVMMLKCNQSNSDTTLLDEGYIALAIDYAADKGARIINMPFCGWNSNENLEYLINYYYAQKQVVFLAATGNNKQNSIGYPARYENVIAVGATECDWDNINSNETRWINYEWASNYGPGLDIVAPGVYFRSGVGLDANLQYEPTYLFGTSDPYTGNNLSTSNAVSFASGVVALLLSAIPCLENHEVDEILKSTAYKLPGYDFVDDYNIEVGYCRIDALAALKYFHFQDITGEETWDYDRIFSEDIIINSGDHLIISNCTIAMSAWAKILVEAGGKLTLDHCTITGLCGKSWPGIEVWGDNTAPQHPLPGNPCTQGKLIMKNGATIENAVVAVELWKPNDYSTTGGIIDATDSYFRNNVISVHALWYRNFNPADPNIEMDYYGTFKNCSFIIDDEYLGDKTFYKHVDLERVRGLKFYGCDFSLEHEVSNVSQWNHAIAAYNAGFHVLPVCTSSIHPCPEYDSCRFKGFDRAIGAFKTTAPVYPILINSAHFNDNSTGIFLSGTDYAVVINNFIEVGYDDPYIGNCGFANGVGIDIHTSNGFAVENNRLIKNTQAAAGTYAGIRVASCPSVHDIIYKNELTGLSYGNYAEGKNRSNPGNDITGIEYQCNYSSHNAVDFIVTDTSYNNAMIRGWHGSRETASGNVFSRYLPSIWHFRNEGYKIINWYYCDPCTDEEPVNIFAWQPEYFEKITSDEFNCPDHYGGGQIRMTESEKMDREMAFVQNMNDFNSVKYLYESLVDGGNTESVLSDIQAA